MDAIRRIFAVPALRWTAVVAVALALGFYAQFESGLPAYALTVLDIDEAAIGLAAAVNCVVIVALQVVVVRLTAKRGAGTLLMAVGGIWVLAWVVLSAAQFTPEIASALFVTTFGIFAVGETMYAPVLNPLTASLAPRGLVGTTLGCSPRSRRPSRRSGRSSPARCSGWGSRAASSASTSSSALPPCMPRGASAPPCGRAWSRSALTRPGRRPG